jgi:predicted RNase H-related nuclease YkuK (DUF458 family)
MKTLFKKLSTHEEIDLVPHLIERISGSTDVKMYIGTDSQNHFHYTHYATVVVLHWGNRGASVYYQSERLPRIEDMFTRLWKEVEKSIDAAEMLRQGGLPKVDYIDLDYNPDPQYKSNTILRSAIGYVESMGYAARIKPDAIIASSCADSVCH